MTREEIDQALEALSKVRSRGDVRNDLDWLIRIVADQERRLRALEPKPTGLWFIGDAVRVEGGS